MMHILSFVFSALFVGHSAASPYFRAPFIGGRDDVSSSSLATESAWSGGQSWSDTTPSSSYRHYTPTGTASSTTPSSTSNSTGPLDPFNGSNPFPMPTSLLNFTDPLRPNVITYITEIPVTNIIEVSTEIPLSTTLSVSGSAMTAIPVTFTTTHTPLVPYVTVITVDGGSSATGTATGSVVTEASGSETATPTASSTSA